MANDYIEKAQVRKNEYIKEAQFNKEKSIAYFNAVNAAIQIQSGKDFDWKQFEEDRNRLFIMWQDWFVENAS